MNLRLTPKNLTGEISAISSKSCAHRLLICASLADRPTKIVCNQRNRDIDATVDCLCAMGAEITWHRGVFTVSPAIKQDFARLNCGESGSTLRFLLPVLCALGQKAEVKMEGRLPQRPLEPLWSELISHGALLQRPAEDTLSVAGELTGTSFTVDAGVSSQYISGLLFALPLLGGGTVRLTGKVESRNYITMTLDALSAFGVDTAWEKDTISVFSAGYVSPGCMTVEGDWSNAAFWFAADCLSSEKVTCTGLRKDSSQGDKAVTEALSAIRAGNAVIDASQIPDVVPILAVVASLTEGVTKFVNAARLRLKESDRIEAVCRLLRDLGGAAEAKEDELTVYGQRRLRGGVTHSRNDHRIAMSAAIASIGCEDPVVIQHAQAVEKSYPTFFADFVKLGGCVTQEEEV